MDREKVMDGFVLINKIDSDDFGHCFIWRNPLFPDYDLIFRSSFDQDFYYLFFKNVQLATSLPNLLALHKLIDRMIDHFWSQNNVTGRNDIS